ncbi:MULTISPECIES: hypothetical protein [unclassified Clostridium]|uniref:hypothetical protein n=1 Tax=unclassified Clostridium TaxID=2614128 RepID=UPI0025BD100A|nr:hypothetical protein [Clostridium sp.]MDY2632915.1 hypothetical protein [Clostridium sp.]MDY6226690.1 hypothetical protein [Clostridium sp.]
MLSGLVNNMKEYKYLFKRATLLIFTFCLSLSIIGCTKCKVESEKTQNYINAVVDDITEESINVIPIDNENVNSEKNIINADSVIINKNTISTDKLPELDKGDKIRIVYNGENVKEDPLKIEIVFAIYLLDENGEVIPKE